MAIPSDDDIGRLSTTTVVGSLLPPEDNNFNQWKPYELGPVALEDISQGLDYQSWYLTYDFGTGEITANAMTSGYSGVVITVPNLVHMTFAFDQSGRISIAYSTTTSSYLYWYDSGVGDTVTTDLGSNVIAPHLTLDDKRETQSSKSDMLLWYTKENTGLYDLYMLIQRERFQTEHLMKAGIASRYIKYVGMTNELRLQIQLNSNIPAGPV